MTLMRYWGPIDGHVHLRWKEYAHIKPSFAELAFQDAIDVGLIGLVEEPNTEPYLDDADSVNKRVEEIDRIRGNVEHRIAVAVTNDPVQREEAFCLIHSHPRVSSGKTFLAKSTRSGGIEVIDIYDQRRMWKHIADRMDGRMVWEGHMEDENLFSGEFDPAKPESHSYRQCPEAELVCFENQYRFAFDFGYNGIMVVKHTSNPDTVDMRDDLVKRFDPHFKVLLEGTPHHMLLNIEDDYPIHGNSVKMNPPLRTREMQERLFEHALAGRIDLIGTDHAPHPYNQKIGLPYKSGIPGILGWPVIIDKFRRAGMSEEQLFAMSFGIANNIYFNGRLKPREVEVGYDREKWTQRYGFNPLSRVDDVL